MQIMNRHVRKYQTWSTTLEGFSVSPDFSYNFIMKRNEAYFPLPKYMAKNVFFICSLVIHR